MLPPPQPLRERPAAELSTWSATGAGERREWVRKRAESLGVHDRRSPRLVLPSSASGGLPHTFQAGSTASARSSGV